MKILAIALLFFGCAAGRAIDLTLAWEAPPGSTADATNIVQMGNPPTTFTNIVYADIQGYKVYHATVIGQFSILATVPASTNQITLSNLTSQAHFFYVTTFNGLSESPPSNWVTSPAKATSPAKTRIPLTPMPPLP